MTENEIDQAEAHAEHIAAIAQQIRATFQASHQLRTWVAVAVLREDVGCTSADFADAMAYLSRFDRSYHLDRDTNEITFSR